MKQPVGPARKVTLIQLVAATYFMVAGGPYGLEELLANSGFAAAIVVLLVTPVVWSLPTALMVGELAGALPEEGGYYAWVREALGPFWGFLEAWLSLAASVFEMAIYPTLFVLYLSRVWPAAGGPWAGQILGATMIALCAAWNLRGASSVGGGAVVMTVALLAPFVALSLVALIDPAAANPQPWSSQGAAPASGGAAHGTFLAAMLVAMWNYMGWDNASTIAGEVERPQRTYPLAMIVAVSLVALTYVIPVGALAATGIDPTGATTGGAGRWSTGSWVDVATQIGGRGLGLAVVAGGIVCAFGMFNALVLSYSRLPVVLAADGLLPSVFARHHPRTGAPYVAIIACALAYTAALRLGFSRLVELDVMLYGGSLILEFVALVALRIRRPDLPRPFRVPGGVAGTILLGIPPAVMIGIALWEGRHERLGEAPDSLTALGFGGLVVAAAPAVYFVVRRLRSTATAPSGG